MRKLIGYMVTWTTYGTWLPGDERGYVEDAAILPGNIKTLERNRQRQKSPTIKLGIQEKEIVRKTIFAEAQRINHKIEALAVSSNHVHLLARPHSESIEETTGRYKSITTNAIWKNGRKGRIWTKGYNKRFCFSEKIFAQKMQYVKNHKTL